MHRGWLGFGAVAVAVMVGGGTFAASADRSTPPARPPLMRATAPSTEPAPAASTTTVPPPPAAPPSTAAPVPAPAAAASGPVVAQLEALLGDPALVGRPIAVVVVDERGAPVFDFHGAAPLLPASTMKLVTAAAALRSVGPDFQYVTRLAATTTPRPDGVLEGSLVLVGAGDPTLATPEYAGIRPERPRTPLEALADAVVASGIRHVTGSVYGDPWVFPHQPTPPGWYPDYVAEGDASRSAGLTVNGGRRLFAGPSGRMQSVPADDPATEAAVSLRHLLRQRGVRVDGPAGAVRDVPEAPVAVGAVASHPMSQLLTHMVRESDNHIADAVLRTVALATRGDARWEAAPGAVRRALDGLAVGGLELDWSGVSVYDGSGLSRHNRLPPRFLAGLDAAMTASSHGGLWQDLMAVAGVTGTLERRLTGSLAHGRLLGKTGSLRDVRSIAGAVLGPTARYHFAVIGNGLDGPAKQALLRLQDGVAVALARDLFGCATAPVPACAA